jgi:hypothetical protein
MKIKRIKGQYRQGDVLIEEVPMREIQGTKQPDGQRIVLAQGEVTGHDHAIEADTADWWKDETQQFTVPRKPVAVQHQEHAPIPLKQEQAYRVKGQREYSPEAIRPVKD